MTSFHNHFNNFFLVLLCTALVYCGTGEDNVSGDGTGTGQTGTGTAAGSGTGTASTTGTGTGSDITEPYITSITSSTPDGTYGIGESINITVTFNEEVSLSGGTLDLTLNTGAVVSAEPFLSALSISTEYIISSGQDNSVLDVIQVELSSGIIEDSAGNPIDLYLPTLTISSGSSIVIETVQPEVTISTSESNPTANSPFEITIDFSEDIIGFESGDITVTGGSVDSLNPVTSSQFTAQILPSGDGAVLVDIAAGTVQDIAGNNNLPAPQFNIDYYPIRQITGTVLDDFTSNPLPDALISVEDSELNAIIDTTDINGNFSLSSQFFYMSDSFVITISKTNYSTDSSVTVTISGTSNPVDGNPIHLYKAYGSIIGQVKDDSTPDNLSGVTVESEDSDSITQTDVTDINGNFQLTGTKFFLGNQYTVNFSKTSYFSSSASVDILLTGDNVVNGNPVQLMIDASISGSVNPVIEGVNVSTIDSDSNPVTEMTNSSGEFTLSSAGFRKEQTYSVNFSHPGYENTGSNSPSIVEGDNQLGVITLTPISPSGHQITGTVVDYWDNSINLAASLSIIDGDLVERTAIADGATGQFTITGNFLDATEYTIIFTLSGYTGETEVSQGTFQFTVDLGLEPQDIGTLYLYPLGIRVSIEGSGITNFSKAIKQTYEKFLTEKLGFTLSARDITNVNYSDTFYVHVDEASQPSPPDNAYSLTVPVNGNSIGGVLAEGIGDDPQAISEGLINYSLFRFYASDTGLYTIETSSSLDTYMYLYNANPTLLYTDDDDGAGLNAKLEETLSPGWYFIKIRGYDNDEFGFYNLSVTGPTQSGITGTWTSNDIILSWYSYYDRTLFIAGKGESGASGTVNISVNAAVGGISRGTFSGTVRAINSTGNTLSVSNGYFNIIRNE
jgi:hypothetical protein